MIEHETRLRVRYAETDQMGYVYYGQYLTYLEVARTEWIRALGIPYRSLEQEYGTMLPVREVGIRYRRPIRYDEELLLKTWVNNWPTKRIRFDTQIWNEQNEMTTEAWVELVFVDIHSKRPVLAPKFFMDLIARSWNSP
jgi:acyl-CoA thioester hydrolase